MVSLIPTPANDAISAAEASQSAALFNLHAFSSVLIEGERGDELELLEMYGGNGRRFSGVIAAIGATFRQVE
jgi:hypothetical protein